MPLFTVLICMSFRSSFNFKERTVHVFINERLWFGFVHIRAVARQYFVLCNAIMALYRHLLQRLEEANAVEASQQIRAEQIQKAILATEQRNQVLSSRLERATQWNENLEARVRPGLQIQQLSSNFGLLSS